MTITDRELIAGFAEAVAVGDASIFLGAGISQGAGLPGWEGLIEHARAAAKIPKEIEDAPLAAEYIINEKESGWLSEMIREEIDIPASPTGIHSALIGLPIRDYWTTNYDNLIEDALDAYGVHIQRIVRESDYSVGAASATHKKRVTKMHGSLALGEPGVRRWEEAPVIARSHFEKYEETHPITWTRLRATWLTNSILFLGLSFDDPNLNLLLRLSRSLPPGVDAPRHYVVFSAKIDPLKKRLQELRIGDLEKSGVDVHVIDNHSALEPVLEKLGVRCRQPALFVSGGLPDEKARTVAEAIASGLTELEAQGLTLLSFGGEAGIAVSKEFRELIPNERYRPENIRFYFRKAETPAPLKIADRIGTAIFTEKSLPEMRESVFPQVRAVLVLGGGERTRDEVEVARRHGAVIIPVASTGGTALNLWTDFSASELGIDSPGADAQWKLLNSAQPNRAAKAAVELIKSCMFE